jgi:hypothetical protein
MTVTSNLQLWLDATDNETIDLKGGPWVSSWKSKEYPGRKGPLTTLKLDGQSGPPFYHPQDDFSPASIEFDYNKTLYFDTRLTAIRTVISVHKYKNTVKTTGYEYTK